MTIPQQSNSPRRIIFSCGCLAGIISICLICSGTSSMILWPGLFGLESTFAEWGLTVYNYENLRERLGGEPAPTPTPTNTPTPRSTETPTPTATFTPLPTFTPTSTSTATPTIPPIDTPARPTTGTPVAQATEEPTTTPTRRLSSIALTLSTPVPTPGLPPAPTETPLPSSTPDLAPLTFQQAQLLSVIDGDTIEVLIDGIRFQVNYLLIAAPEASQPYAAQATELNAQLLRGSEVVRLGKDGNIEADPAGRLLRYVYAENFMVNEELVRRGLARVTTAPAGARFSERFLVIQQEAQAFGFGIWSPARPPAAVTLTPAPSPIEVVTQDLEEPIPDIGPKVGGNMVPKKDILP